MSFSERWFLKSLSKDKIDNNDKKAKAGVSVNSANIVSRGMKSKNQHTDLFHDSGEAIKVYLPPLIQMCGSVPTSKRGKRSFTKRLHASFMKTSYTSARASRVQKDYRVCKKCM